MATSGASDIGKSGNIAQLHTAIKQAIENYRQVISKVKEKQTFSWDGTIQPLEEAAEALDRNWRELDHLNAVANTQQLRDLYEELLPALTNFHTDIMQDEKLYKIFVTIRDSQEFKLLSDAQKTIINNALRDFSLSGIDLSDSKRAEYRQLVEKLSALENNFSNNLLDASEGWTYHISPEEAILMDGLPQVIVELAKAKAADLKKSGWVLTLDQPCYEAVLCFARSRSLREQFYYAYYTRASDQGPNAGKWDNSQIIEQIIDLRTQLAYLLGFNNYAEYSLVPKMADNTKQIIDFLHQLIDKAKPKAQIEYQQLQEFAKNLDNISELQVWDVAYYSELKKQQLFDLEEEKLRVYFPAPRVIAGLFKLAQQLFGITIREIKDFNSWHESVQLFEVYDSQQRLRGSFYTDLYTRPGKRGGAWMAECLSRMRFADDVLQAPVAYLNCNFAPPTFGKPALLKHDDVITLFHEFGHTLHHVLTQVDYYSVSGMNGVAWDAIELPSQFMENWCWEWPVIQDISAHIDTGLHLPRVEYDKLIASKHFQSALALLKQIEYTLFDLRVHMNNQSAQDKAQKVLNDVRKQVAVIMPPAFNRFQNSFGHIFAGGYAAGYYSYLWAEVLSCDAFDKFMEIGVLNSDVGAEFMRHILEQGGSKPAMDLFVAFAGREPNVDALLRHHAIT